MGLGRYVVALMIGAPGAGKGTQAHALCTALGVPHIATGDLLREHRRRGTTIGAAVRACMDRGDLVPDELVTTMLIERLSQADAANGALLDGFPRTLAQAQALDRELAARGGGVHTVIFIDVPPATLVRRLADRRVCIGCQRSFNISQPPLPMDGTCPGCGDQLVQRADDCPGIVAHRVEVYAQETAPVLEHYGARGLTTRIDGDRSVEAIRADVLDVLREHATAAVAR